MPRIALAGLLTMLLALPAAAQTPENGGPYNAHFLQGGVGIVRELKGGDALVRAGAAYTISAWVRPDAAQDGSVPLIVIGDPNDLPATRWLELAYGTILVQDGGSLLTVNTRVPPGQWTHVAAVSDGATLRIYVNGREVAHDAMPVAATAPHIEIAPVLPPFLHFGGSLVSAKVDDVALTAKQVAAMAANPPDFDVVQMWQVGVGWEFQKTANTGYWRQQDAWTLPQGKGGVSKPVARPVSDLPMLAATGAGRWQVNGWRLAAAPDVKAAGDTVSQPGFDARTWWAATVPGTVLTTLVDRGVYPDPYYGLNNLAIPEKLSRQDYWYRTSFTVPAEAAGKRLTLVFNGINYASEVWLNGQKLGGTRGAFIRGRFDIAPVAGENVIAVRVMPPPHPGIPHEQSIKAGVGENGGQLAIDGPTFVDTEGWDWIPGIRDRDTGIWLPVELEAHGDVVLGDPQIVTDLPLPRTDSADISIRVPVTNVSGARVQTVVRAQFDGVSVSRSVDLPPGTTMVGFSPATDPQLHVENPKLWWPNGYGDPALHDMTITAGASDTRHVRFGIREVSYDLSLFDSKGALRRVNVQPTDGKGVKLIDVSHTGIKLSPRGYAESLTAAGEHSPGVTDLGPEDTLPEPHLAIRVNGVKIAARGGSWGMDDAMKRIGRDRLEPAFRLERDAHMNIIRNWMGTNTEPLFYDLADEYGMMVLNDFWQSTQNFQIEPEDPALFVANVRDAVSRYRNHPSIVVWFGRNEGVPYPVLNEGIDDAIAELDGTRWYTGSSNSVNLQGSGPYNYRAPAGYFEDLATGFSVETGTPSLSTIESIKSYVPEPDRWPLSDTLAYHDWHFAGNGDTRTFMAALDTMFGAGTSLEDFERKAQMMNLETHKAMVEGFLGHLWTRNSGRLFWMTHPSWPSNAWQLYSWDYDTAAAYYGAKKAAEPLHVQLNLPDNALVVLNTTREDRPGLSAVTRVVSLDNRALFTRTDRVDALANRATPLAAVPLDAIFAKDPMVLVQLRLMDGSTLVSENFYWRGKEPAAYRALNAMPRVPLRLTAGSGGTDGQDELVRVVLQNQSPTPALNAKLTLVNDRGRANLACFLLGQLCVAVAG
jgi:beta-galactosidase/beta-glucuronidase